MTTLRVPTLARRTILLMALLLGCRTDFTPEQLYGVWRPYANDAKVQVSTGALLSLSKNGTFYAHDLPPVDGYALKQTWSGDGKWTLLRGADQRQRLLLKFRKIGNEERSYGTDFFLRRSGGSIVLFAYVGDPDDDVSIAFKR